MKSAYLYVRVSTDEQKERVIHSKSRKIALLDTAKYMVSKSRGYTGRIIPQKTLIARNGKS